MNCVKPSFVMPTYPYKEVAEAIKDEATTPAWIIRLAMDYKGVHNKCAELMFKQEYDAKLAPSKALKDVITERRRQIEVEGWTPEHDSTHEQGMLTAAGMSYGCAAVGQMAQEAHGDQGLNIEAPPDFWPWDEKWWKPTDVRRNLVKAAALIIAEIDRMDKQCQETP